MLLFFVIFGLAMASPDSLEPVMIEIRHGDFVARISRPSFLAPSRCIFDRVPVPWNGTHVGVGVGIPNYATISYGYTWKRRRELVLQTESELGVSIAIRSPARLRLVGAIFSDCEIEKWLTNRDAEQAFSHGERRVVMALLIGRIMVLRKGTSSYLTAPKVRKGRRHFEESVEGLLSEINELEELRQDAGKRWK